MDASPSADGGLRYLVPTDFLIRDVFVLHLDLEGLSQFHVENGYKNSVFKSIILQLLLSHYGDTGGEKYRPDPMSCFFLVPAPWH